MGALLLILLGAILCLGYLLGSPREMLALLILLGLWFMGFHP